ncbi:hypothetical protein FOH10_09980 [Nocardia otitidiscaviarum]|uniref:DUF3515 domain-containing protein n=1 Tax=Nocardia otitidiscaviarum TaxID=1823 RepID=A0A516NJE0_9NOCA|nr:hypothetical protein [Nocardia otitidiscaviarum]MCP9618902.1 hypothetical protein [Nocardia otitidiscaviarum]QDP79012.1 hypothetical protein FOH10_09980 [Nocardia otitidiscaviarum]
MRYFTPLLMVAISPVLLGCSVIADAPDIGRATTAPTSAVAATTTKRAHTSRELCEPVRDFLAGVGAVGVRIERSNWPLDRALPEDSAPLVVCRVESDSELSGFISMKRTGSSADDVDLTELYPEPGYSSPVLLSDKRETGHLSVKTYIGHWIGDFDVNQQYSRDRPETRQLAMSDDQVTAAVQLLIRVTRGLDE